MIELKNVTVKYDGGKMPVEGFTLTLPERGVVALTGKSGCGKTTVLKVLAGLIKPTSGEVNGMSGKRMSMVFQEDRLLEWLNVKENVEFAITADSGRTHRCAPTENARDSEGKCGNVYLDAVELSGRENDAISELSGGMKRRVAIARALCYGGDVIFMDEPYKGLDEALAARVHQRVREKFPLIIAAVHEKREAEALGADIIVEI